MEGREKLRDLLYLEEEGELFRLIKQYDSFFTNVVTKIEDVEKFNK